jgi:hypothetical protein
MNDEEFFAAHSDSVIALLASYALSPEFSKLKFRVTRNDAFYYVMLYFSTDMPFSDYEISIRFSDSQYVLAYTTWDMNTHISERHQFAFDDLAALRARLKHLKPFIVDVYEHIIADWKSAFEELEDEEGED